MKRIIALLLTMVMTASCCAGALATETTGPVLIMPRPETDTPELPPAEEMEAPLYSSWAEQYLADAKDTYEILVPELIDCDYRESITRAEFCVLLYETISYIREIDAQYNHKRPSLCLRGRRSLHGHERQPCQCTVCGWHRPGRGQRPVLL